MSFLKQILLTAAVVWVCACSTSAGKEDVKQKFIDDIYNIISSHPDSALTILDKGLEKHLISEENYMYWHATALYQSGKFSDAAAGYEKLLNMIEGNESSLETRMKVMRNLSYIRAIFGDYESAVRLCIMGDSLAKVTGNSVMQADFCSNIGFYSQRSDNDAAEKYLQEAISIYKSIGEDRCLLQICQAELYLITVLEEKGRFDRALDVGKDCMAYLNIMEESESSGQSGFDRCRFNLYSCLTTVYAGNGMDAEARAALAEMKKTDTYRTFAHDKVMVNPLMAVSEFTEAEKILQECRAAIEAKVEKDSLCLCYNYIHILELEVKCLNAIGLTAKAKQTAQLLDSLTRKSEIDRLNLKIKTLSTSYEVQKKEFELQEARSEIRAGHFKTFFLLVVSILLACIICVYIIFHRRIIAKNSKLIEYIASPSKSSFAVETSKHGECGQEADEALREEVSRFIISLKDKELYLDSGFKENILLSELNIKDRNFRTGFRAVTGKTLPQYLTGLRVAKAAQLIQEYPSYTFEYIAEKSGLGSRTTLYRAFTSHYGLTPKEYRSQSK